MFSTTSADYTPYLQLHPFSNLDFSGLGQPICVKLGFATSKRPKSYNRPTFSKRITGLLHFWPHQTLCFFLGLRCAGLNQVTSTFRNGPVIFWRRANCQTSFERACSELSYDPYYLNMFCEISLFWDKSPSKCFFLVHIILSCLFFRWSIKSIKEISPSWEMAAMTLVLLLAPAQHLLCLTHHHINRSHP